MWVVLSQHGKAFVFTRPVFRMQILLTQSQLIGQLEIALELPTIFNPILTFRCQNCTVQQKGRKKRDPCFFTQRCAVSNSSGSGARRQQLPRNDQGHLLVELSFMQRGTGVQSYFGVQNFS